MKISLYIILIAILLSKHYGLSHMIRKRQLFREQVLPHAGGKIPDSAFLTDRLALNRLQKDGIAVPDGVLLEQRQHQVFPHQHRTARPTFRVAHTPDGRYTSPEGEYSHNTLATVETTYLIPHSGDKLLLHDHAHHRPPSYAIPKVAALKELHVPNYAVFNFDYKKKAPHAGRLIPLPARTSPPLATFNYHPLTLEGPWAQRLPQDFVSYHAAVGNGLHYPKAHTYGSGTVAGNGGVVGGGWSSGWAASTGGASGESFAAQPLGHFEDYFNRLDEKHRFYRNVADVKVPPTTAKGPKPGAILQRDRGHSLRHQA